VWKIHKFTLSAAVLLLLPWVTSAVSSASRGSSVPAGSRIEAADRAVVPAATFSGNAYGSVTPGDLFYFYAADGPPDMTASLYLTNAHELAGYLSYLILKVTLYSATRDGQWQPITGPSGSPEGSEAYLTLRNSPVKFTVHGSTRYKIRIDSGSFYCLPVGAGRDNQPPKFYLTLENE
jgi:hypothetical protein